MHRCNKAHHTREVLLRLLPLYLSTSPYLSTVFDKAHHTREVLLRLSLCRQAVCCRTEQLSES